LLTGCAATPPAPPVPSVAPVVAECGHREPASGGVLSARDVWTNAAQSGHAGSLTTFDKPGCPAASTILNPRCDQDAPWMISNAQLAGIGVSSVRTEEVVNVVGAVQSRLTETIFDFYPDPAGGPQAVVGAVKQCGGNGKADASGEAIGYTLSTGRVIVIESADQSLWPRYAGILRTAVARSR
jgi:hypothetical protein